PLTRSSASPALTGFIFQLAARRALGLTRAGTLLRLLQNRDSRQLPPLEVLQCGAAACRYPGEAPGQTELFDRGGGVAAAAERVSAGTGDRLSHSASSLAEVRDLEHAHRTVPPDRPQAADALGEHRDRFRADVERHP